MHSEKQLHIQFQKQDALHQKELNDGHAKTLQKRMKQMTSRLAEKNW